jgi:hypothetical protein
MFRRTIPLVMLEQMPGTKQVTVSGTPADATKTLPESQNHCDWREPKSRTIVLDVPSGAVFADAEGTKS